MEQFRRPGSFRRRCAPQPWKPTFSGSVHQPRSSGDQRPGMIHPHKPALNQNSRTAEDVLPADSASRSMPRTRLGTHPCREAHTWNVIGPAIRSGFGHVMSLAQSTNPLRHALKFPVLRSSTWRMSDPSSSPHWPILNVGIGFSNKGGVRLNLSRMDRFISMIMLVVKTGWHNGTSGYLRLHIRKPPWQDQRTFH
jgi:hypothetical protein